MRFVLVVTNVLEIMRRIASYIALLSQHKNFTTVKRNFVSHQSRFNDLWEICVELFKLCDTKSFRVSSSVLYCFRICTL